MTRMRRFKQLIGDFNLARIDLNSELSKSATRTRIRSTN